MKISDSFIIPLFVIRLCFTLLLIEKVALFGSITALDSIVNSRAVLMERPVHVTRFIYPKPKISIINQTTC